MIDWAVVERLGAAGILLVVLILVLKWVFKNQARILEIANAQNTGWQNVITRHTENAKTFQEQMNANNKSDRNAHEYQRKEHDKIMKGLDVALSHLSLVIKDSKECHSNRASEHDKMIKSLDSINENLVRINGYKQ